MNRWERLGFGILAVVFILGFLGMTFARADEHPSITVWTGFISWCASEYFSENSECGVSQDPAWHNTQEECLDSLRLGLQAFAISGRPTFFATCLPFTYPVDNSEGI